MNADPSQKEAYKQVFDMIRPRSLSAEWMFWAAIGFAVVLVALLWGGAVVLRRRGQRLLRRTFQVLAQEKGLTGEEEDLLWRMGQTGRFGNPLLIFTSMSTFEHAVDREFATLSEQDEVFQARWKDLLGLLRRKLGFDKRPPGWPLGHTREISEGQRLLVGFKRGEHARFCSCMVVEVDAGGITITPIVRGDEIALQEVTEEEVLYIRFWRRGDTEYKFRSHLLPESDPDRVTLRLAHGDPLERAQRRDFFRTPVNIQVTLYSLPDETAASRTPEEIWFEDSRAPDLEGTLVDLSAGGAALRSKAAAEQGEFLAIGPEFRSRFSLAGIACRVTRSEDAPGGGYTHHLEFVNVDEALRDRLVQQIYRRQIERA